MSNSMQATNNLNKVQTPTNNGKANPAKKDAELNFNDLFSSALGQNAPNAQLNSIESQLRESLFKQEKSKKNNDSNPNAEAAQAAVWAQRNWMQSSAVLDSAPQPSSMEGSKAPEKIAQSSAPQQTAEQNDSQAAAADKNASQSTASSTEPKAQAKQSSNSNEQASTAPTPESAASTTTPSSDAKTSALAGESSSQSNGKTPEALTSLSANTATNTDTGRTEPKTAAQTKADAVLANSIVTGKADAAQSNVAASAGNSASANSGNASAVAAQLGQQISQQASSSEGLGEEGLKVGQKILAAGGLQSTGTLTGMAAGTNGLTSGAGTVQPTLIKTPVNQPGFAKEMGQTVQWAIGKNLSTVDIRVNPESFGPMNMRLVQKGQQIQLIIRTQDEASANLLTQALGGLKEVLAQNGLQLNQVQIQTSNTPTPQGQASGQTNDQANNGQAQFEQNRERGHGQGGQTSAGSDKALQDGMPIPTAASSRKPEGTLDLFA